MDELSPWLQGLGGDLYWYCVDFVLHAAHLTGLTYRDVNALIFLVLWPLATVALLAAVVYQSRALRRLR